MNGYAIEFKILKYTQSERADSRKQSHFDEIAATYHGALTEREAQDVCKS